MVAQKVNNLALKWLQPSERTAEEVAEYVCVEHFVALLPYKLKCWVTCHQPPHLGGHSPPYGGVHVHQGRHLP